MRRNGRARGSAGWTVGPDARSGSARRAWRLLEAVHESARHQSGARRHAEPLSAVALRAVSDVRQRRLPDPERPRRRCVPASLSACCRRHDVALVGPVLAAPAGRSAPEEHLRCRARLAIFLRRVRALLREGRARDGRVRSLRSEGALTGAALGALCDGVDRVRNCRSAL